MNRSLTPLCAAGLLALVAAPRAVAQQDHPFTLVNVVDLFAIYNKPTGFFDLTFPTADPPPNWTAYMQSPRMGNSPAAVATDGERAWVAGFYNGANYTSGGTSSNLAWYASIGVAEVPNILTISGSGDPFTRYLPTAIIEPYTTRNGVADSLPDPLYDDVALVSQGSPVAAGQPIIGPGPDGVLQTLPRGDDAYNAPLIAGPGTFNGDWISGLTFDEATQTLYLSFDDNVDSFPLFLPTRAWQPDTYIGGVDVNPQSATYGKFKTGWPRWNPSSNAVPNPLSPAGERSFSGITHDALDARYLLFPNFSTGFVRVFDALNPSTNATLLRIYDQDATGCNSSAYRSSTFDPSTGDFYIRQANGVQRVDRDTRTTLLPFQNFPRFIREPVNGGAGGNLLADTAAIGDDEQLVAVGQPAGPGQNIIGVGVNGVLDTTPAGDDQFNGDTLVTSRVVGNNAALPGSCAGDDPTGFAFGTAKGQGLAFISAANLANLSEDLILATGRALDGDSQLADIRFFRLDGSEYARLDLPCTPPAGPSPCGLSFYDADYHAPSGTLVISDFESRKLYVFRANVINRPVFPRYDFTRNGSTDLADFWGFQQCFTGQRDIPCGDNPNDPPNDPSDDPLSLNCHRVNSDSDCDVDFDDYLIFQEYWDLLGGP